MATILLIEDDTDCAEAVRVALSNSAAPHFQLEWVTTCADAIDLLAGDQSRTEIRGTVAAILLGLQLRDSEAVDMVNGIFGAAGRIPILVLLPTRDREIIKWALMRGARDCMFKGEINSDALPQALRNVIERSPDWQNSEMPVGCDVLAELYDKTSMSGQLERAMARAGREGRRLSVLIFDVDRFGRINALVGYGGGDRLLQCMGQRLASCVGTAGQVGRQGRDEFLVLLDDNPALEDAVSWARRLLEALRKPYQIGEEEMFITASVGITLYPDHGRNAETLLANANYALCRAKDDGSNTYHAFAPMKRPGVHGRRLVEHIPRTANWRREFILHYQPRITLRGGALSGVEALLRWGHPTRGLLPPGQFLPIAAEFGLLVPIGKWVLRECCRQAVAWQVGGLCPLRVAVNISAVEFRQDDFVATVNSALSDSGMHPSSLEIELTESFLSQDLKYAASTLDALKDLGVRLALDDFGTGRWGSKDLGGLPLDILKIDGSLVRDVATDRKAAAAVRAAIAMGRKLGMRVVAEGVETADQFSFLFKNDCPDAQGYYFGRPMSSEELAPLIGKASQAPPTAQQPVRAPG